MTLREHPGIAIKIGKPISSQQPAASLLPNCLSASSFSKDSIKTIFIRFPHRKPLQPFLPRQKRVDCSFERGQENDATAGTFYSGKDGLKGSELLLTECQGTAQLPRNGHREDSCLKSLRTQTERWWQGRDTRMERSSASPPRDHCQKPH